MIWLTCRQFRTQASAVYAAVAAFAIVLAITGPRLHDLARIDANVFDRLTRADRNLFFTGTVVIALAPAVIGAFWGAPMVARELETGTHRLAWNQSVTRSHWLATKLGVTSLAASAGVGVLALAITWWAGPIDGALGNTRGSLPARLTPVTFAMRGIAPVAYTVFALVLGVAVGAVLRRTLPAMAVMLALFAAVQIAVPLWVRPHLIAPSQQTVTISRETLAGISLRESVGGPVQLIVHTAGRGDWILSNQTVDSTGRVTALPSWFGDCLPPPPPSAGSSGPGRAADLDACFARLTDEGYRQKLVYQPAARFWPLQWAETGLFLVLSGLLIGFCFWWTRRRLS